jgi:hypothetical protein
VYWINGLQGVKLVWRKLTNVIDSCRHEGINMRAGFVEGAKDIVRHFSLILRDPVCATRFTRPGLRDTVYATRSTRPGLRDPVYATRVKTYSSLIWIINFPVLPPTNKSLTSCGAFSKPGRTSIRYCNFPCIIHVPISSIASWARSI